LGKNCPEFLNGLRRGATAPAVAFCLDLRGFAIPARASEMNEALPQVRADH
jgi:hypothetical protein